MFVTGNLQFFINNFSLIVHKLAQIEQAARDRQDRSEERISDGLGFSQERTEAARCDVSKTGSCTLHSTVPVPLLRQF